VPGSSLWCWDGSLVAVVSFAGAATETCHFNHVGSGSRPGLAAKYNYASVGRDGTPRSTPGSTTPLFVPFTFLGIMVVLRAPPRWACHALEDA
jgi:hypothetical protein